MRIIVIVTILFVMACSGSSTRSDANLVRGKAWTLSFPDGCTLNGLDQLAKVAECPMLGNLQLSPNDASEFGLKVAALSVLEEETVGGNHAVLTHFGASYRVAQKDFAPIETAVRKTLSEQRITAREQHVGNVGKCAKGEVVHFHSECGPIPEGELADVCGPAVTTCGAPLANGAKCGFHGSCASGRCNALNTCE